MFVAFERGADDVVSVLRAARRARCADSGLLDRRAVLRADMLRDPITGALTEENLALAIRRESERVRLTNRPACLAYLALHKLSEVAAQLGQRAQDAVLAEVVELVRDDGRALDEVGFSRGQLALLLPDTSAWAAQARLNRLVSTFIAHTFSVEGCNLQLTPVIGFAELEGADPDAGESRAWTATMHAAEQLDLQAKRWRSSLDEGMPGRGRSAVGSTAVARRSRSSLSRLRASACPFSPTGRSIGPDSTSPVSSTSWSLVRSPSLRSRSGSSVSPPTARNGRRKPPEDDIRRKRGHRRVPAERGRHHRRDRRGVPGHDYTRAPGHPRLQHARRDCRSKTICVRSPCATRDSSPCVSTGAPPRPRTSTPRCAHVDRRVRRRVRRRPPPGPGLVPPRVALVVERRRRRAGPLRRPQRRGRRHPQLVAAEFEAIYAVGHPGRARVHGFGIFGGSNGYWRTSVLERTRLRGSCSPRTSTPRCASWRMAGGSSPTRPGLDGARTGRLPRPVGPADALGPGLVPGLVALPLAGLAQPPAERPAATGTRLPARLARGLPVDLAPDLPDPRVLAPARLAADLLGRPGVPCDDRIHVQRRRLPGVDGLASCDPRLAPTWSLVPCLRPRLAVLLYGVQECRGADGAREGVHGRAHVEGDPQGGAARVSTRPRQTAMASRRT